MGGGISTTWITNSRISHVTRLQRCLAHLSQMGSNAALSRAISSTLDACRDGRTVAHTEFSRYLGNVLFLVGTDRRKLALLLPLYLISSAADLVGIGLLVALITALKDPETLLNVAGRIPVIAGFVSSSTQDALTVML